MADLDAVNKAVRTLIRTMLGEAEGFMRPANQNAPAGSKTEEFGTVFIMAIDSTGFDDHKFADVAAPSTNVRESVKGQRAFTASVQFFRGAAYNKASRVKALLEMSGALEKMQLLGLGFIKAGPARNLTAVVDTYWEARAQIDVDFHVVSEEALAIATYNDFRFSFSTEFSTNSFEVIKP